MNITNVMEHVSEVSIYYKKINGTTVLCSFLHDAETVSRKVLNSICELDEIGQWSISNLCNSDETKLNDTAQECVPMKFRKSVEHVDGESKRNEGWANPENCVPETWFYKNNNKIRKNNNVNNIRCNIFVDDTEIDAEQEEDTVKKNYKRKMQQ